jgi:dTDP-4-dehydrorhamnose 3,5-epimerase
MNAAPTKIADLILLEAKVFGDEQGLFFVSFNQTWSEAAIGRAASFVQDNHPRSVKNVLRGLFCKIQQPQGKLVRVVQGVMWRLIFENLHVPLSSG